MDHLAADAGNTEHQEDDAQNELHGNQCLRPFRSNGVPVFQEGGDQGNSGGNPAGDHRVAQQYMQVIEEAVNDNHGERYFVADAQHFGQHGDGAQTGNTHKDGLHHFRYRPCVVDERKTDLENTGFPIRLFLAVFAVAADELFVCHMRSLFLTPKQEFFRSCYDSWPTAS